MYFFSIQDLTLICPPVCSWASSSASLCSLYIGIRLWFPWRILAVTCLTKLVNLWCYHCCGAYQLTGFSYSLVVLHYVFFIFFLNCLFSISVAFCLWLVHIICHSLEHRQIKKGRSASSFETARSFSYLFCKRPVGLHLQSPLCVSAPSSPLHPQLKLRCLISNLLRTLSPFGDCGLTRHNIRAGLTWKRPRAEQGQREGKRWNRGWLWMGAVQRQSQGIWWCLGMGTAVVISVATSAALQLKAFSRMRKKSKQTLQGCGGVLYLWQSASHKLCSWLHCPTLRNWNIWIIQKKNYPPRIFAGNKSFLPFCPVDKKSENCKTHGDHCSNVEI